MQIKQGNLILCCYRHGFPPIGGYTDDVGWGCTIRSFQMLIANTISVQCESIDAISFVVDDAQAPFSLQNIVLEGKKYGIEPGDWFAPSVASKVIRDIMKKENGMLEKLLGFQVMVYGEDLLKGQELQSAALVILPVKLGVDTIDASYHETLYNILEDEHCKGIIGGHGSSSHYFIGLEKETGGVKINYIDPHEVREHGDPNYVCKKVHKMAMNAMNPSVAVAVFVQSTDELDSILAKYEQLFTIADIVDDGKKYSCIEDEDYCVIMEEE